MTKREIEMNVEFENFFETSWTRMRVRIDASSDHRLCWTEILHILHKLVDGNPFEADFRRLVGRNDNADAEHLGAS